MARRRIGCACIGPSLAPGPAAPAPLRPHARAYAYRGLPASCFALPWRAANARFSAGLVSTELSSSGLPLIRSRSRDRRDKGIGNPTARWLASRETSIEGRCSARAHREPTGSGGEQTAVWEGAGRACRVAWRCLLGARLQRAQDVARRLLAHATGGGYHCTCWSKTYSGCGWARAPQSGRASTGGSSQAGGTDLRGLSFRGRRTGYCRPLTSLQRTLAWRARLTALGRQETPPPRAGHRRSALPPAGCQRTSTPSPDARKAGASTRCRVPKPLGLARPGCLGCEPGASGDRAHDTPVDPQCGTVGR